MSRSRQATNAPRDNSSPELKARLRLEMLRDVEAQRVLDCFCGRGEMYARVYKERAAEYVGLDREKVHDPRLCLLMDNRQYLAAHDVTRFTVFDLDAYGCPWGLLYRVLERAGAGPLTVFVTDGLPEHARRNNKAPHIVSATNHIPKGMTIPASVRWYEPMFKTMLLDVCGRHGWTLCRGLYAYNERRTVCYWGLHFERANVPQMQM